MLVDAGRHLSRLVCRLWKVGRRQDGRVDQESSYFKSFYMLGPGEMEISHQNSDSKDLDDFYILKILIS